MTQSKSRVGHNMCLPIFDYFNVSNKAKNVSNVIHVFYSVNNEIKSYIDRFFGKFSAIFNLFNDFRLLELEIK